MTRLYGHAPKGRRLLATAPFGHWKTTTFVAALRRDSLGAPMVLNGPMIGNLVRQDADQLAFRQRDKQTVGDHDRGVFALPQG